MKDESRPAIIFDTDMDTDCDDTGALVMLLNAARRGEIELPGIIADAPVKEAAPCCEAFCRYYGVDVPVGAVYEKDYADDPRFADYRAHRLKLQPQQYYNRTLAQTVGRTDEEYPQAARLYRQLLAQAADGSVTIVCVGFLTALGELLQTQADDISPLSGVELVRRKVQRVVSMGELPAEGDRLTSFNYYMDLKGTETVFETCPVPICVSPVGTRVITGAHLTDALPEEHPLRIAYENWNGPRKGRSSWDLVAVLQAMQPGNPWQRLEPIGMVRVNAAQQRMWREAEGWRQDMLVVSCISDEEMAELLNGCLQ